MLLELIHWSKAAMTLDPLRQKIRDLTRPDEAEIISELCRIAELDPDQRRAISSDAADLVRQIRASDTTGLMEVFLGEYGLSTKEGVALMCLAEALLRVPDPDTMDALIEDKIAPSDWGKHLGHSASTLVNASTWALMLTGRVLDDDAPGISGVLHGAIKRLGEPVIRAAVGRAMKELGSQFVLGRTISEAQKRSKSMAERGYTFSYDMLGEAARTDADARRYHLSYADAIGALAPSVGADIRSSPGISVKLSALYARYEYTQKSAVMDILVPRARALALLAKSAGMGFNIDAEEADRLDLSLDVIEAIVSDPSLRNWDGFGIVVQAYSPRASAVIDWIDALARKLDRRFMVRLVKGAYWDTEIKRAQTLGLDGFPVFTNKAATDISYIANARKLLSMTDRIYPQFATHNAHSVAAILSMGADRNAYEFQRLHGMGGALHDQVIAKHGTKCRVYAPVGAHKDLLAYLVRRLLENGANSSFVNQIVDVNVAPEVVAADPFALADTMTANPMILNAKELFIPQRSNAKGWDIFDPAELRPFLEARNAFRNARYTAGRTSSDLAESVANPARPDDSPGTCHDMTIADLDAAIDAARPWDATPDERARTLAKAARMMEDAAPELAALLAREAGKTINDAISEIREAVDFLYYYGAQCPGLARAPLGLVACISPWNFPLAIFTGQVSAALAAGNGVLAKPAESTPLIAAKAVKILLEAGVPETALTLTAGPGSVIGARLSEDRRIDGIVFTGSTQTAQRINRSMAKHLAPQAPLIAETGGLNAMIVDSTALPEQAVRDIIISAFQSAGQRCSALRVLYLQEEVAEDVLTMLTGAMDLLTMGDPWDIATDIGPVIDAAARNRINAHIEQARSAGRVIHQTKPPADGFFVAPTIIRVNGIADLDQEVFGPVLHVATFRASDIPAVVEAINASGYGLTFGLHTRIDDRVESIISGLKVGNAYVNRNQIGAIVGSQPFGGEGLSGTGPKAGGPHYLPRLTALTSPEIGAPFDQEMSRDALIAAIAAKPRPDGMALSVTDLPGPTGESNRQSSFARGRVLCMGPGSKAVAAQARHARRLGCSAVIATGAIAPEHLTDLNGIDVVFFTGPDADRRAVRKAIAARTGPILPLVTSLDETASFTLERHLCVDTTAAGGNAALLAAAGEAKA